MSAVEKVGFEVLCANGKVSVQRGEDRWLCTLLLKRDYRVEYCAASDAYTHCPEGFNDFFIQRRRWMPSTIAHNLDLVTNYKRIIEVNENMSRMYILYQVVLIIGTVIGPATIFLMLVGGFAIGFDVDQWTSFGWNIAPILLYFIVCAIFKSNVQLFFAGVISAFYGLIMMAVLVGIIIQIQESGWLAPSTLFFFCIAGEFIITALLHPQEFYCLKYGIIYYVTVPSMYVLLIIYTVFNMNNVSWGTREITVVPKPQEENGVKKEEGTHWKTEKKPKMNSLFRSKRNNTGPCDSSCVRLFKSVCCTCQTDEEKQMLRNIQTSLAEIERKLYYPERNQLATDPLVHIEGSQASRVSIKQEEDSNDSILAPSDDISWHFEEELTGTEITYLDRKEEKFWTAFVDKYLYPLDDAQKKVIVKKDLKDLRDKMVITFFMINSLLVLVIFLLNLHRDIFHVKWPFDAKIRFTYNARQNEISVEKTFLQLDPIAFVFIICFIIPMVIQFISMLCHRFNTFSHIMATTAIDKSNKTENLADELIQAFKKIQKIDEDDEEIEAPAARRNTVHTLATNRKNKSKCIIENLDEAFVDGMSKLYKFKHAKDDEKNMPIPRRTLAAIWDRRDTVSRRRMSEMPNSNNIPSHSNNNTNYTNRSAGITFEDPTCTEEHSS